MRREIPFLILILIWAGGAAQASAGITPRIDTNVTSGPSPLAVSFNATGTNHTNSTINTNRFADLVYLWDYDDPGSGAWNTTGKSRNHMSGPLGAHVFEPSTFPDCGGSCKVYTVQLTVKDAVGGSSSSTKSITVYSPDDPANGWGGSGKSICISKAGNFSGCPATAGRETNSGTFNSILSSKIGAGYRRILFHAGETWNMTASYGLSANGPGLIGAFGSGKATVEFNTGSATPVIMSGDDWRIQDLHISGSNTASSLFSAIGQERNWLVQRTTTASSRFQTIIGMALNQIPSGPDESIHRHIFFIDNHWGPLASATGHYQIFAAAWGLNILGNEFERAPQEHTIRVQTGADVLDQ